MKFSISIKRAELPLTPQLKFIILEANTANITSNCRFNITSTSKMEKRKASVKKPKENFDWDSGKLYSNKYISYI